MNLITYYDQAVSRGEIQDDPQQRALLNLLQPLMEYEGKQSWLRRRHPLKGLYVYGSVGIGKSFLIDLFFQHLPLRKKARFHFHHFMQQIDMKLRKIQGQKNPLKQIAKDLAKTVSILCFDEFLVHDVAHAMILAELLQELIQAGVILVISSNTAPDDLYLHGVQRARFLPAIALIKKHCEISYLMEKRDYRRGRQPNMTAYLFPINEQNQHIMETQFLQCANNAEEGGFLRVQNRDLPYLKCAKSTVWFDFNKICNLPRCQSDYLEIANRFDTVFLSGLPVLDNHTIQTLLFIYFIDVLYDQGIRLFILAEVNLEKLYTNGSLQESFKRTLSRLNEMQSLDYLMHPRRLMQDL